MSAPAAQNALAGGATAGISARQSQRTPAGLPSPWNASLLGSSLHVAADGAAELRTPGHLRGRQGVGRAAASRRPIVGVTAPEAPQANEAAQLVRTKEFQAGRSTIMVRVFELANGDQHIEVETNLEAGALYLHWGVEGGTGYKGGWRLPAEECRPAGTLQYKDRALQSPFTETETGNRGLNIVLRGAEASDRLNFVLKDAATNTWWDDNADNFSLGLRSIGLASMASICDSEMDMSATPTSMTTGADLDVLPSLPEELCNIWAYIGWEYAGCPNRSPQESEAAFAAGIEEMKLLLRRGTPMDELWKVARGQIQYSDYKRNVIDTMALLDHHMAATVSEPTVSLPSLPQEMVNIKAYILWEQAGEPPNTDFGPQARAALEQMLRDGLSLEAIERSLKEPVMPPKTVLPPPPGTPHVPQVPTTPPPPETPPVADASVASVEEVVQEAPAPPPPPPPAPAPTPVHVGEPMAVATRDPLALIKAPPSLSAEKFTKKAKPLDYLVQDAAVDEKTVWRRLYALGHQAEMFVSIKAEEGPEGPMTVYVTTDSASDMVMHWGVCAAGQSRHEWSQATPDIMDYPKNTSQHEGGLALETSFIDCDDEECDVELLAAEVPLQRIKLVVPDDHKLTGLNFVLRSADGTKWWKDGNSNFQIPLPGGHHNAPPEADPLEGIEAETLRAICAAEASSAWTLMHRYNRAADLLGELQNSARAGADENEIVDAAAAIYCWLRYSQTRQLTWQRHYNTQPRILSAAQARLTSEIAATAERLGGEAGEWVRASLATVGRGGDGQAIRDEILHIMHRNGIGERKAYWIEQWHQKLHNNTTPDDVAICEAYIAFVEGNGDRGAYWRILSDAGITRERLEGFDRAIVVEPEMYDVDQGSFVHQLRDYLKILKAVHSGADLQASATAAQHCIPDGAKGYLGYVLSHLGDTQVLPLMQAAVEARTEIHPYLAGNRELMYLDLALEDQVRQCAERATGAAGFGAAAFVQPLLQNLCLSLGDNEEVCYCLKAWQGLPRHIQMGGRPSQDEALQASAVVDRVRRALAFLSDRVSCRIEPIARGMGRACGIDDWVVDIFAEEVVRGGPAFALSLVVSAIEPELRSAADLGAWQIISPQPAVGRVRVVDGLHEVQDDVYDEPTILIASTVGGEEEIPEGAVALISPDAPDVLSHVAVRARNMRVLFATCHDRSELNDLRSHDGGLLSFAVTAAGAVTWGPATDADVAAAGGSADGNGAGLLSRTAGGMKVDVPRWGNKWVVDMDSMVDGVVGAKSKNIAALRGKLPEWVHLPASVTVPFGAFEDAVLSDRANARLRRQLRAALDRVQNAEKPAADLAEARDLVMQVQVPSALQTELKAHMAKAGIPVPQDPERWALALNALRGVWASKYNDRAFYSMRKIGFGLTDLRMAVLVQRVVPAEYAFVIHTTNPTNGDSSELFAELVKGLGESLVSGTVPGSSLTFTAPKSNPSAFNVVAYPSKSDGMFVPESLIFRSDSNGEDLEGYAGAGLYESITMDPTVLRKVDMSSDPIVADPGFQRALLEKIIQVGIAIEDALGSPQDIEGVVDPDGNITVVQTRPQV